MIKRLDEKIDMPVDHRGNMSYAVYNGVKYKVPVEELRGAREKFWMKNLYGGPDFLVKKGMNLEDVGEVLFYEFCRQGCLDVDVVPYHMEEINFGTHLETAVVCPSYLYRRDPTTEFSGARVFKMYNESPINANDKKRDHYTINNYRRMLEFLFPEHKGIEKSMTHLTKMAMLDYITLHKDRHFDNFAFFISPNDYEEKEISPVPIYDSGSIFGLAKRRDEKNILNDLDRAIKTPPMLGVVTPIVPVYKCSTGNLRVDAPQVNLETVETFEKELAESIVLEPKLGTFYTRIKKTKLDRVFSKVGHFLDDKTLYNIESFIHKRRVRLEEQVKRSEQELRAGVEK
jgi:hypothetical protein